MDPVLHPFCQPVGFLLGTWTGDGKGEYPTIEPLAYGEEIRFWHVGKPFLASSQRTWSLDDGRPLHAERAYWRPQENGALEVVATESTGVVEVLEGPIADGSSM